MNSAFRFLYLNLYALILLFCGIGMMAVPLFTVSKLLLIPQIFFAVIFIKNALRFLASWQDKKRTYAVLVGKNKNEFRPESFKIFMQVPCGRLLVKAVLHDIGKSEKYKELLKFKKNIFVLMRENCTAGGTYLYVNEDFIRNH